MFNGLNNIKEIDLSLFDFSLVTNMSYMFNDCYNLEKINIGKINTSSVMDMRYLFMNCKKLTSIDLSYFDTHSVINMTSIFGHCETLTSIDASSFNTSKVEMIYDLFAYCFSLVSVDISCFDTSKVTNMQGLFYVCTSLKYVDLQNFDISSVVNLRYLFTYCSSLVYLNLKNFKIINFENVTLYKTFSEISPNVKYCIEDSGTKNFLIGNAISNCSDIYFQDNIQLNKCTFNKHEFINESNLCHENSYQIWKNEIICVNAIPENYYFDNNDNIYKECYYTCKKCNISGNEINNNCDECIDNYTFINESLALSNNCFIKCEFYYYFNENNEYTCTISDICPTNYNKIIKQKNKCIDDCKNDNIFNYEYNNSCLKECPTNAKIFGDEKLCLEECYENQFEYNNNCYNDCPTNTFRLFINRNVCVNALPENYYLDNTDNIYKECYNICKKCNTSGNEENNNCDECISNYIFIKDSSVPSKNCYLKCEHYYYLDENNKYFCTNNSSCPYEYPKLIEEKKKCVKELIIKDTSNNVFYEEDSSLPEMYLSSFIIGKNLDFENLLDDVQNIPNHEKNETEEIKYYDKVLEIIGNYFTNENYNLLKIENGEEELITLDKMIITLTTTQNQKNNTNSNMTIINLGECEN